MHNTPLAPPMPWHGHHHHQQQHHQLQAQWWQPRHWPAPPLVVLLTMTHHMADTMVTQRWRWQWQECMGQHDGSNVSAPAQQWQCDAHGQYHGEGININDAMSTWSMQSHGRVVMPMSCVHHHSNDNVHVLPPAISLCQHQPITMPSCSTATPTTWCQCQLTSAYWQPQLLIVSCTKGWFVPAVFTQSLPISILVFICMSSWCQKQMVSVLVAHYDNYLVYKVTGGGELWLMSRPALPGLLRVRGLKGISANRLSGH